MRQAFFAVLLVAASFAGGAAVNGPGLRWAQDEFSSRLGLDDEETTAPPSAALQPLVGEPDGASDIPAKPIPPLVVEPGSPVPPKSETKPTAMAEAGPVNLPSLGGADLPPLERSEPAADARAGEPAGSKGILAGAAVALASLADKAKDVRNEGAKAPSGPEDWPGVRRSLRDLGASRYGVEGPPEGRVRFFCVIPVAGRRAVSQYFEAEGDDELQAARAAIRRVVLWRATEGGGEGQAQPIEAESASGR